MSRLTLHNEYVCLDVVISVASESRGQGHDDISIRITTSITQHAAVFKGFPNFLPFFWSESTAQWYSCHLTSHDFIHARMASQNSVTVDVNPSSSIAKHRNKRFARFLLFDNLLL
jgi:hypothetical protein